MEGCSPGLHHSIDHFLSSSGARGIFDSIVFISFSSVCLLKRKEKDSKTNGREDFMLLANKFLEIMLFLIHLFKNEHPSSAGIKIINLEIYFTHMN